VNNLVISQQSAGYKSVKWDATDSFGKPVSVVVNLYTI
ncbi:uncharacterized protein METZ01_LOCUS215435, partial [marine metagenome]